VLVLIVAVCCLGFAAQIGRALVVVDDTWLRLWYVGLGGATTLLCVYTLLRTPSRRWAVHGLLAAQCLLIVAMTLLSRGTEVDFMVSLFIPLAAVAAVVFTGATTWVWVGVVATLSAVLPLVLLQDPLAGLAQASVTLAPEAVLAAYVVVARDLEAARRQSKEMLDGLRTANARLEASAARAGELAAVAERDRVARDLNDSVAARIDGIVAAAEVARQRLAAAPAAQAAGGVAERGSWPVTADAAEGANEAAALLASIQAETQQALADMRGLITELRPTPG
jgi:signal transduction histidine kinase